MNTTLESSLKPVMTFIKTLDNWFPHRLSKDNTIINFLFVLNISEPLINGIVESITRILDSLDNGLKLVRLVKQYLKFLERF